MGGVCCRVVDNGMKNGMLNVTSHSYHIDMHIVIPIIM